MKPLPILLVITAGVALGLYLGWLYLRRERSKPVVIGLHVVLGVVGLEGVAMLITGGPGGGDPATGQLVKTSALLLVLSVMTGFASPLLAKKRPRKVGLATLGVHAAVGMAGYAVLVAWALRA
jgi:hypothetical protein